MYFAIAPALHLAEWDVRRDLIENYQLWALPFLLAFVGGVYADILETRYRRWFLWITGGLLAAQAALCVAGLPLLVR